jgi:nucleotide-binding universal stress UspA family protein
MIRVSGRAGDAKERMMAYRDIMVYLDPSSGAEDRLRVAVSLASAHAARLIGVDASSNDAFLGSQSDVALRLGPQFEAAIKAAGVTGRFVGSDAKGMPGAEEMHSVDLIVAPRASGEARSLIRTEIPDGALIAAGAPMLILPEDWRPGPVGENVVIAWNASREATRAVHDAMPLLAKAKQVTIFAFSARPGALRPASERLAEHLARHGVASRLSDWTDTGDLSALEALFADLDTQNADLIIAGAFGHSRLFETLFGGVSLDLMRQPTVPIFMSH